MFRTRSSCLISSFLRGVARSENTRWRDSYSSRPDLVSIFTGLRLYSVRSYGDARMSSSRMSFANRKQFHRSLLEIHGIAL